MSSLFEVLNVTNQLVSRTHVTANQTANDASTTQLAINSTGSKIAYVSKASDLVNGQVDAGNTLDLFLFERSLSSNLLVSSASTNAATAASGASSNPTISDDGRYVAYESIGAMSSPDRVGRPA